MTIHSAVDVAKAQAASRVAEELLRLAGERLAAYRTFVETDPLALLEALPAALEAATNAGVAADIAGEARDQAIQAQNAASEIAGSTESYLQELRDLLATAGVNHEWDGTSIRLRLPDGEWGEWVDLEGPAGTTDYEELTNTPDLAAVALSGAYGDLEGRPSLGSASEKDVEDFATADQGWKADTAMQPSDYDPNNIEGDVFDLSNQYGTKPTEFPTVAALLADEDLSYSALSRQHLVEEGTRVRAGGFDYDVAASDATGNDIVETAGGVRLRLLPLAGFYFVDGLGAKADSGVTNQTTFDNSTDNYAVMQRFFDLLGQTRRPGCIGTGQYRVNQKVLINYNFTQIIGPGPDSGGLIWGGGFDDVVATASSSVNTCIILKGFAIRGGIYQKGTARYSFYAEQLNRGSYITDMLLREGLGLIYISRGWYCYVDNLRLGPVVPNQTINGCSDSQWLEVNGEDSAPVFMVAFYGGYIGKLVMSNLAGEARVSDSLSVRQAMIVHGLSTDCGAWTFETTGVEYSTYTPSLRDGIKFLSGATISPKIYFELVKCARHLLHLDSYAQSTFDMLFSYLVEANNFIRTVDAAKAHFENYKVYACSFSNLTSGGSTTTPASPAGRVTFGEGIFALGGWRTDAAISDANRNVFDTAAAIREGGTVRELGAANGAAVDTSLRWQGYRKVFPRKLSGLEVTSGSGGDGSYVQIAPGSFMFEDGSGKDIVFRTNGDAAKLSYFRLRPDEANRYYRVWVGAAGQMFLAKSSSDPVAVPEGDWIASFETDGSNAVTNLTDNPRLSLRGTYKQATQEGCEIVMPGTSLPSAGYFRAGTEVIFAGAGAGDAPRARCVTAGSPGTWENYPTLDS